MYIKATFFSICLALPIFLTPMQSDASSLNQWRISCGVDKGSITKKGGTWTFKTSSNKCPGGIFKQRAEISTNKIKANHRGKYLFQANVSMMTRNSEKFDIFQIHDGRRGCAPPLKVDVQKSGNLKLISDIKTGKGESCIRGVLSNKVSSARISRNGKTQKLEILVDFNGKGGFDTEIKIDGKSQIKGAYRPSKKKGHFQPKFFYFKHGVYSQRSFNYVMTSKNMRVRRVR